MVKMSYNKIPIIIATRNRAKSEEIMNLLKDNELYLMDLNDFPPIPEVIEDGDSFEENAYKKACFTARMLGLPSLAEDSGIIVDALGGKPGVLSARYAGDSATDEENYAKLLIEMEGKENRRAKFVSVIAIAVPDGQARLYRGECEGRIANRPSGNGGFGYDPVFYYPPLGKTFAELSIDEKGRVSHRGRAIARMKDEFSEIQKWLRERLNI
jgi:XTP/dITP diphosphohydrolase